MSEANKYQPYSADDILRYLEGKMSAAEMRRLELAALDDPFLQDAIDGYKLELEKHGRDKMLPYLQETLANPIVEKKEPAPVIPFFRMGSFKWAVAAALIIGSGLLWFNLNKSNPEQEPNKNLVVVQKPDTLDSSNKGDVAVTTVPAAPSLQQNDEPGSSRMMEKDEEASTAKSKASENAVSGAIAKNNSADADKDGVDDRLNNSSAGVLVSPRMASASEPQKLADRENNFKNSYRYNRFDSAIIASNAKPETQNAPVLKETISGKVAGVSTNQNSSPNTRNSFAPNLSPDEFAGKMEAQNTHYLAGKTIDKEKFPLDHIVIAVKGDTTKTMSDELGRFSLKLPDSVATVVAYGVGVKPKEFNVNSNAGKVELELAPAETSLSEVVVSGYSMKKRKAGVIELDLDTSEAAPAGGWKNFERYVMENRKIKPGKNKTAIVVSIEIEESGKVGDMEIIESGGNALDKEALRLLREGPKWINKTKNKVAFAKVTIVL